MTTTTTPPKIRLSDYSLVGKDTELAIEKGLAEATWYMSPVPKQKMRELLQRRDWPGIRDSIIWFGLLILTGVWGWYWWTHWSPLWALIPFAIYSVIYASTSDSRWHESSHGTAFKTDWLNNALYEVASFMVFRESVPWRWSHTRHHSDTIIVGRDPEIAIPRPPDLFATFLSFFNVKNFPRYAKHVLMHSTGTLSPEEKTYIPESEYSKVFWRARIYFLIYASAIGLSIYLAFGRGWGFAGILPLMYIGIPNLWGAWLMPIYGYPQHAGLAENVLDHRLNCRTIYMNPINRFFYWNMNYHLEHHMFPLVPYHNLPKLHALIKDDTPKPYTGLWDAWKEIVPAVLKQVKDPAYHVKRVLPTPTDRREAAFSAETIVGDDRQVVEGWVEVCAANHLSFEDVVRFDHGGKTFAVYCTAAGEFYATDGICTHGNTHLANGMVKGNLIECPKHNGRFNVIDGSPKRKPVCVALQTYPVKVTDGRIMVKVGGGQVAAERKTYRFRVISNENVATFIKEVILEPVDEGSVVKYQPGDYLQWNIPAYGEIGFKQIEVKKPFSNVWEMQHVFDFRSENKVAVRRNYSLATNPELDRHVRLNVRIATPPRGQACNAGAGSAYMHCLKPGDIVTATGPFGDFHIKPTDREMVYLGGGSGMAPLRSHISYLLESLESGRKISYWYGARSMQEVYYREYFEDLARRFPNFTFHLALSEPLPEDNWTSHTGYIHEVLKREYLDQHPDPKNVEYYMCGPPTMVQAALKMLAEMEVSPKNIAYDEF